MSHGWEMTRRTALRGLGTAIALPLFDSMLAAPLWAAPGAAGEPIHEWLEVRPFMSEPPTVTE